MVFLPHTNTVILLEPHYATITEPGLPVIKAAFSVSQSAFFPRMKNLRTRKTNIKYNTVKSVLGGHRIKRTPSIEGTLAEVPKFISLIYFK